jgi:integrase
MRRGEILGLSWANVDLDDRMLRVHQALQRLESGLAITEVKTERSRRTLAVPDSVVRALKGRRTQQIQERLKAGLKWQETGLVFTNPNGGLLEPITLHRDYKRLLNSSKLPEETRFHDLRHSAASLLLAQGVQLRIIMEAATARSPSLPTRTRTSCRPLCGKSPTRWTRSSVQNKRDADSIIAPRRPRDLKRRQFNIGAV